MLFNFTCKWLKNGKSGLVQENPMTMGWRAAKQNFFPGLGLQVMMVGVIVLYFTQEGVKGYLDIVAGWKQAGGYRFSFIATAIAAGVLPEMIRWLVFQKGKWRRKNGTNLTFGILFWGVMGMMVDALYRGQGILFGNEGDIGTVLCKVGVDMLGFTPFFAVPCSVILYRWKDTGYQGKAVLQVIRKKGFISRNVVPVIFACWAVWFPVVSVIYAMPAGLQIPVFVAAEAFWVLILTTMSEWQTKTA